ncbi:MAG: hypothetical protein NZ805_08290 [Armatimonadetes bacterium]|nr:hypothetical protein [Armatimonadota bacterium]MDW8027429.1 hypothetical protein [Armatimonadota bacterium]
MGKLAYRNNGWVGWELALNSENPTKSINGDGELSSAEFVWQRKIFERGRLEGRWLNAFCAVQVSLTMWRGCVTTAIKVVVSTAVAPFPTMLPASATVAIHSIVTGAFNAEHISLTERQDCAILAPVGFGNFSAG